MPDSDVCSDPALLDFPCGFESERLLIRSPQPGDGEAVREAVAESLAELRPWLPWATHVPEPKEAELNARRAWQAFMARTDLRLFLFLKETGCFVGGSGLHRIDWKVPAFEIGYWCRSSLVGQGFISEAVRSILQFARTQLKARRIEIRCDPQNTRSIRIPERLGLTLEGTLRSNLRSVDGELRDTRVYSVVFDDETSRASKSGSTRANS